MNAFWSGTDNRDEKDLRFFGVFGKLNTDKYENKHRTFIGDEEVTVDISDLFEVALPVYSVTIGDQEIQITQDKIIPDTSPRSIIDVPGIDPISVLTNSIKLVQENITIPKEWLDKVNTPVARETVGRADKGRYSDFSYYENREKSCSKPPKAATVFDKKVEDAIEVLDEYTSGFTDVGTTLEVIASLEESRLLHSLYSMMSDYLGDYGTSTKEEFMPTTDDTPPMNWMDEEFEGYGRRYY